MSVTKTFDDEFTNLSLWNGSNGTWQPAYSWSPGGYRDTGSMSSWLVNPAGMPADANVYSVSNGVLSMAIKPTPADVSPASVGDASFLSGQLTTQQSFSQLYGYFEMNAELPAGAGTMSAFWLLPENGAWPPELDAEEIVGSSPGTLVMTTHTAGANGADVANPQWTNIPDSTTGFHTYAVDWEPTTITWYFDGKQVAQAATPADMNTPMYMLVDDMTGLSSSWEGAPAAGTHTAMQINWIHAYSANPYTGAQPVPTPVPTPTPAPTPTPPPTPGPIAVTVGTGSDTLVLSVSEDAYANGDGTSDSSGDATFTVAIDGKQQGGTFTASALHSAGAEQAFTFNGDWAPGGHTVTANFLNDAYAGTASTDRNLYVDAVKYDGIDTSQSAAMLSAGPQSFTVTDSTAIPVTPSPTPTPAPTPSPTPTPTGVVTGAGSDALVLSVSEDAYANGDGTSDANGDATFTVSVDGKQLGGTFTAAASHAAGVTQSFTFNGNWTPGAHTVTVNFLNDAYAGTTQTDRNLYVDAVSYDGKDTNQSATLLGAGPQDFSVTDNTAIPGTPPPVIPYITPGIGQFADAAGNIYTLDAGGNATENGQPMPFGGGTSAMEYANSTVYAQDAGGSGWYTPAQGSWVATATPPNAAIAIPAGPVTENVSDAEITASAGDHMLFIGGRGDTVTLAGGTETVQALQGGNSISTGSGADKLTIGGSGNIITAGSGANQITDQGSGNTFILPGAGGSDSIFGPILQNGDVLDLRGALAATNWNGASSTLAKYLSTSTVNNSAVLTLHAAGGRAGSVIATLENSGPASLTTILAHAIT